MEADASDGNYSTGLCIRSVMIKSPCVNHSAMFTSLNALVHITSHRGEQTDPQLAQLLVPEQTMNLNPELPPYHSPARVSVSFSSLSLSVFFLLYLLSMQEALRGFSD